MRFITPQNISLKLKYFVPTNLTFKIRTIQLDVNYSIFVFDSLIIIFSMFFSRFIFHARNSF